MKRKLLIVDDEQGIVDMMRSYFSEEYDVLTAYNGKEAIQKAQMQPDLILLDINMPGMDGLSVCRNIRNHVTCPILFLTARIESADQIVGFQAGGDDYIVKPFDLDELDARVAAHLRREQRRQNISAVKFFGELAIDYTARTVTVNGEPVTFSRREFDILELLSLHTGQVFDRERIYESVWGIDGEGSSDVVMDDVIILSDSKEKLHEVRKLMDQYLQTQLNLHLKDNWQVFPVDARGIDFIGFRCFHGYTLLRKRTYKRFTSGMLRILEKQENGQLISYSEFCSANSYCGWLDMCDGNRLKEKYIVPIVPSLIRYYEEVIAAGKKNKAAKIRKYKKKLEKKGLVKAA